MPQPDKPTLSKLFFLCFQVVDFTTCQDQQCSHGATVSWSFYIRNRYVFYWTVTHILQNKTWYNAVVFGLADGSLNPDTECVWIMFEFFWLQISQLNLMNPYRHESLVCRGDRLRVNDGAMFVNASVSMHRWQITHSHKILPSEFPHHQSCPIWSLYAILTQDKMSIKKRK